MRSALLLVALALAPGAALADFVGRVTKINDGDMLTVLLKKRQIRVRLDGIDAPERGQAFNERSRQSLAELCAGKTAEVEERGTDGEGRVVGIVTCGSLQANAEQVRRGLAWAFRQYVPIGSPLYELEAYARLRELGLWADPHPVAPWEWRKRPAR